MRLRACRGHHLQPSTSASRASNWGQKSTDPGHHCWASWVHQSNTSREPYDDNSFRKASPYRTKEGNQH